MSEKKFVPLMRHSNFSQMKFYIYENNKWLRKGAIEFTKYFNQNYKNKPNAHSYFTDDKAFTVYGLYVSITKN